MSGIFTRLVQQSISQHNASIEPIHNPVFSSEITQAPDSVETHQEPAQANAVSKHSNIKVKPEYQETKDVSIKFHPDPLEPISSRPLIAQSHLGSTLIPPKNQVVQEETDKENAGSGNRVNQTAIDGHVIHGVATIQPQIQAHSKTATENVNLSEYTVEGISENKARSFAKRPTIASPQSLIVPVNEKFPAMASRRSDNGSESPGINRHQTDYQSTTINVSIGQIDIAATSSSETMPPKKPRQSNRKPSVSLDDYQRQRQQGDR